MFGDTATAKNVLLKDAPDGQWMVDHAPRRHASSARRASRPGLVLWNGENPNTFAKIVFINKGTSRQFEYVATRNGGAGHPGRADVPVGAARGVRPRARRRRRAPTSPRASLDGETWQQIAAPIANLGDPTTLKIGLKVSDGADAENAARFLYFRVDCSDRIAPERRPR